MKTDPIPVLTSKERTIAQTAALLGLPFVSLADTEMVPELFDVLSAEVAVQLGVIPLSLADGILTVAISDPLDISLEERLRARTQLDIALVVASPADIAEALRQRESSARVLKNVTREFSPKIVTETADGDEQVVDLRSIQGQSGVVRLMNSILMAALQKQVSDIHIEAQENALEVKYRIDGVLYPATETLDTGIQTELISRLKVMAELDISERRSPQDGRFKLRFENRDVDFRVSILPTPYGEDAVIRVLDKASVGTGPGALSLDALGLTEADILLLRKAIKRPFGMVLVTGPTGSGKTTTLYTALSEIATGQEKVITIEDPIEYRLANVVQIAVNEKKGLSFATGLRSILRHDPDKIMVGEIRDRETAEIAIQAALTGHLVFATVHANNAFDVISRFSHWGVDLRDFITSLNLVIAQRLLRRVCAECAVPAPPDSGEVTEFSLVPGDDGAWQLGQGCAACFGTGYAGRSAAIEHLAITPAIADLMIRRAALAELVPAAEAAGWVPLRHAAVAMARAGRTTLAEVRRVTADEW